MDELLYYSSLYDFYKNLLTDKQRDTFKDYFFENLTLEEIASNNGVSKNAISKTIISIKTALEEFENKLHFKEYYDSIHREFKNDPAILSKLDECDQILFDERTP